MQVRRNVYATDYVEDLSKGLTQLQCQKCLKDFVCEEDLSVHWGEVHGPKLYPCNICGLRFILPSVLEKHKVVIHDKDSKMRTLYRCNLCALEFISEELLERHNELVHPKDYHCEHCGKVFHLKRQLHHHIQEKHVIRYDLGEDKSTKTSLTRQLEEHGDNQNSSVKAFDIQHDDRSRHVCNKCGKVLSSSMNLRKHCDACGDAFDSVGRLEVHKKEQTDEKPYVCTVCSMRLKQNIKNHNSKMTDVCKVCTVCGLREHSPICRGSCIQELTKHSSTCREPCYESSEVTFKSREGQIKDQQKNSQYNCPLCLQYYMSKKMLRAHFVRHHSFHICSKCGKVLISLDALKIHMNIHTEVKSAVPRNSDERDKNKHEDNRYNCQFCMEVCESKKLLETHISQSHRTTHVCYKCGKILDSLATLSSHMKTHTGGDSDKQDEEKLEYSQFACQFCMEVCESKELLETHISRNHRSRFVCDRCGRVCSSAAALRNHIDTHTVVERKNTFKSIEEWLEYKDENNSCLLCMKVFKSEKALKGHFKRHHTSCTCDECGKVLSTSKSLRNHKNVVHKEAKPFACTICDKRFKYKGSVTIHLRMHTGERPFFCEMCSKSFINVSNLKKHLCLAPHKVSTEESSDDRPKDNDEDKQINCPFCAQVFKSKEMARLHIASSHKSHVCETCGKVLCSAYSLKEHMSTHSGVKPFACTICDKRFSRRYNLACHMVVHTDERPFRCKICSKGFTRSKKLKQHKCQALQKVSSGITTANSDERVEADQI